jgi:hypothetical protein
MPSVHEEKVEPHQQDPQTKPEPQTRATKELTWNRNGDDLRGGSGSFSAAGANRQDPIFSPADPTRQKPNPFLLTPFTAAAPRAPPPSTPEPRQASPGTGSEPAKKQNPGTSQPRDPTTKRHHPRSGGGGLGAKRRVARKQCKLI